MNKRILFSFMSIIAFMPQLLYSISLADYIAQHGMPQVLNGSLNLINKNLTDLTGLQNIPNIDQVSGLMVSENQLRELPVGIFNGLNNLRVLYLNGNQLQTLPVGIFNGLHNLGRLLLSNNQLQTLPAGIFNGLINLRELYLNGNQLQELPEDIFNGLINLQRLSLAGNQLQALPADIFNGLNNLQNLLLLGNQLKTLPVTIFNGLNNLRYLDLKNNPFKREFLLTLPAMLKTIPSLLMLDYEPIDKALKSYPAQPKTLQEITKEYAAKKLNPEQIAKTAPDIFIELPLSAQQKAAIIAKNMDIYRDRLIDLPKDILDLLARTYPVPAVPPGPAGRTRI